LTLEDEIFAFETQESLLRGFINDLAKIDTADLDDKHHFLAEAVTFRLYRIYERLMRSAFLNYCVASRTIAGNDVISKLKCDDWQTAESILKSGNKFLDWGNVDSVQKMADFIFINGFRIRDMVAPIYSDLKDLQRFRNFVAHDSIEASNGFKKARTQYIKVGGLVPETVGELALYRKNMRSDISLKLLHKKVSGLSAILRSL
jgi:hypothetical protein